jgi:hypothetical protein
VKQAASLIFGSLCLLLASAGVLFGLLFDPKDGGKVSVRYYDKYSGFGRP